MVIVHLCGHSLLFSCSNQNFQSVRPHSFQIDWIVFCHCCHICSDCYICSVRSCGNWLLTAKDLLTLKSVACVLCAAHSVGQLQQLRQYNSPNSLLFPPSKLQKSKSALLWRRLSACSEQTQALFDVWRAFCCCIVYSEKIITWTKRRSSRNARARRLFFTWNLQYKICIYAAQ